MEELDSRSSLDIVTQVRRYTANEISLHDLEDWIVPRLGALVTETKATARDLAGIVELGLAELSIGDMDEAGFRRMLKDFELSNPIVFVDLTSSTTLSSNSAIMNNSPYLSFGVSADRPVRYERIRLGEAA